MEETRRCPKCDGELEKGFIKTEGGYCGMQKWGKEVNWRGRVKGGLDVSSYRCKSCGYLEMYAE